MAFEAKSAKNLGGHGKRTASYPSAGRKRMRRHTMTAKIRPDEKSVTGDQLEEMFDNGDDILAYVDLKHPVVEHHPPLEKRVIGG